MDDINQTDIRRIDGGLLLVFRELFRRRRQKDAAERLGLSQPAVSHALGRLRDIFGDQLFIRRSHGLEPTQRAFELANRVDTLIDLIASSLQANTSFEPKTSSRRFNLAATEFGVALVNGAFVNRMRHAAPNASFTYRYMRGFLALDAIRRGELDAVLGRFESVPTGLKREILVEDRYCVVARRGHPTIDGSIDLATWATTGHIFAASLDDVPAPSVGEDPLPQAKDVAAIALVPRWEVALELVSGSDSIATCPRRLAVQQADALGLQVLEPPYPPPPFPISIARRDETDPGLDWFCEQLRPTAERPPSVRTV